MPMRKLKRSIAKANMIKAGLARINKKQAGGKSFFSKRWREWLFPGAKVKKVAGRRRAG